MGDDQRHVQRAAGAVLDLGVRGVPGAIQRGLPVRRERLGAGAAGRAADLPRGQGEGRGAERGTPAAAGLTRAADGPGAQAVAERTGSRVRWLLRLRITFRL